MSLAKRRVAEARFAEVFAHLGAVTAYARRRGAVDPEEIAAETMAIAWRKLSEVPVDDPRPWLFATARNTLFADRRRRARQAPSSVAEQALAVLTADSCDGQPMVDPELVAALRTLREADREALLLIAWEDLTPALAAASLGISQAAFRVRLYRARRRCYRALALSLVQGAEPRPISPTLEQP
jgi:RNA polymerase sigma-70 factor (ECF subfamily)